MLLLSCYKIYPNKLTPKELEIDGSEQVVYVNATRKIVYTVKGDIHFQMPVGTITQNAQ